MTTRIVVAAGLCTPSRVLVQRALAPYGVRHEATSWMETADGRVTTQTDQAAIDLCAVLVNDQAARWAEYLLLRTGVLRLVSPAIDPRNARWALRHRGAMPRPWVQPGCNIARQQSPAVVEPAVSNRSQRRREGRPGRRRREY